MKKILIVISIGFLWLALGVPWAIACIDDEIIQQNTMTAYDSVYVGLYNDSDTAKNALMAEWAYGGSSNPNGCNTTTNPQFGYQMIGSCRLEIWFYRFLETGLCESMPQAAYAVYIPEAYKDLEDCEICNDLMYCIKSASRCKDGGGLIAVEYYPCYQPPESLTWEPDLNSGVISGQVEIHEAIQNQEPLDIDVDYVSESVCTCSYDQEALNTVLDELGQGSICDSDQDTDGDGVTDNNDRCPDTEPLTEVNEMGCPVDSGDGDNDGVPDEQDLCPETRPNRVVDEFGCYNEQQDYDSDGDGINDAEDLCPDTPAGTTVGPTGCDTNTDDGDGTDNDDDTGLLKGISDWLKKISGQADTQTKELQAIGKQMAETKTGVDLNTIKTNSESLKNHNTTLNSTISQIESPPTQDWVAQSGSDWIKDGQWDLQEKIMEVVNANPVSQAITGIDVQASGDCSFTWDYKGHPVTFSVCNFADELNIFGQIVLMLSSLNGLILIFKR